MKPSGHEHGITLEDLGEINTATEAVRFLGDTMEGRNKEDVQNLGRVLIAQSELLERLAPLQEAGAGEPSTSLDVGHEGNRFDALVVRKSLEVAAKFHPDELVRHSAEGMLRSYEEAVYEQGMNPRKD